MANYEGSLNPVVTCSRSAFLFLISSATHSARNIIKTDELIALFIESNSDSSILSGN